MIEFKKATLTNEIVKQLIELSEKWVEEDCSFGLVKNTKEDLHEPLFVAIDINKVVGYIFGKYYVTEKRTSYIEIGSSCFEVEELYVLPEYRNQGIGRKLFSLLENEVASKVQYITLGTSTKDYEKTLKFYVKDNKMTYHSAFLIKSTSKK